MLNIQDIRRAYFNPPPDHLDRPLTREEHIARHERHSVAACVAAGGDPRAAGLGEHGSLIGGPEKPLRTSNTAQRLEYAGPWNPLPLSWFTHPRATMRRHGRPPANHPLLRLLIGAHLAGYPDRPAADELAAILRSDSPSSRDRSILYHVLGCIEPWDLSGLLHEERLSVHELARAIHFSGIRRPQVIAWLHMFAAPPGSPAERQPKATGNASCRCPPAAQSDPEISALEPPSIQNAR